jgi:2-hydroxychromene-2-carboxylate isomerase
MDQTFHFYFDLGSPASYLAFSRIRRNPELLEGVTWHPMLLGAVLKQIGNQPPTDLPSKRAWMEADFQMFARIHRVPFSWSKYFPVNTLGIMRLVTAAREKPEFCALLDVLYPALWVDNIDPGNVDLLKSLVQKAGVSPDSLLEASTSSEVKERLKTETGAAIDRGVFGAPTFIVRDRLFFGQDRLEFAEAYWKSDGRYFHADQIPSAAQTE